MNKIKLYQADSFTDKLFGGNPAAACPLDKWLDDKTMQNIAAENNLSETGFYIPYKDGYFIRWFTPKSEVDLCGHVTLASSFFIYELEGYKGEYINFYTSKSGILRVRKNDDWFTMDFPSDKVKQVQLDNKLLKCFDRKPTEAYKGKTDYMLVFEKEDDITNIKPEFGEISNLDARGIIVTAKSEKVDFVSRFFAPGIGVSEDPVTGSAHTTLTPYWANKLNKEELNAIQLSSRKGYIKCKINGDRVEISGQVKLFMKGEIFI